MEQRALVANRIQVPPELLPYEIARGVILDRATEIEINRIKELLPRLVGENSFGAPLAPYECDLQIERIDGSVVKTSGTPLPKDSWRYYVVRTDDNGNKNIDLTHIALISELYLDVGTLTFSEFSYGWHPHAMLNRYRMGGFDDLQVVTKEMLDELARLFALQSSVAGGVLSGNIGPHPELQRALTMLNNLRVLPDNSTFHVLGLFAIIEMLITHNPQLEDKGDSITRQMKTKIPLLSRRFDRPLPYHEFFGNIEVTKVWGALYSYRSAVAHGGEPDFVKDLRVLKDRKTADAFLTITVESLIRNALYEPDLYKDLRQC